MSESTIQFLFASLFSMIGVWNVAITWHLYKLSLDNYKMKIAMLAMSKTAAKFFHHVDDRYKIDHLADKYIERHYELTYSEWQELLKKTDLIAHDTTLAKDERLKAEIFNSLLKIVEGLSAHKLAIKPVISNTPISTILETKPNEEK